MPDVRAQRLASVLVRYSTEVKPGELCTIEGDSPAEDLVQAIYEEVLRAGAHPVVLMSPERAQAAFFALASGEQLEYISPLARQLTEQADVRIRVLASANPRELSEADPQRQVRRQRANAELMERVMARSAAGELRWALCQYPTNGYAAEAEMSLATYEDFLYGACLCDREDPVAAWRAQGQRGQSPGGVDRGCARRCTSRVPARTCASRSQASHFIAADGKRNMPDGEFFTGPVEDSAQGTIRFHLPSTYGGREVAGVCLRFEEGVVVDATAERGEELLLQMLDSDPGARRLGELGIGTNFAIARGTRSILFDEKIGGTVHLALGRSYPETGGVNESSLHWDMICDLRAGGTLTVDGEALQRRRRL